MPFNGAGLFTRIYSWVTDAAAGLLIDSERMDTDTDDIASGLSLCITRDGQSALIANLPMGGFKLTGLGPGTMPGDSVTYSQALLADGGTVASANIPMGGFKFTGLGPGSASGDSVNYGQVFGAPVTFYSPSAVASPPINDSSTLLATTAFVNSVAFAAVLPGQPGGTGVYQLESTGGVASWTNLAPERTVNRYALNMALRAYAFA